MAKVAGARSVYLEEFYTWMGASASDVRTQVALVKRIADDVCAGRSVGSTLREITAVDVRLAKTLGTAWTLTPSNSDNIRWSHDYGRSR